MTVRAQISQHLRGFHKLLLVAQRSFVRYPRASLALSALLLVLLSLGGLRLQFLLSIDDLVDSDFQTYHGLKKVNEAFNDKNTILLSIESNKVFTKSFLCDLQSWILKMAEDRKDLLQIQSTFGVRQAELTPQNQFKVESFLAVNCLNPEPELEKIEQAFRKIRASPWGRILSADDRYVMTVNFIVRDPADKRYGSIDIHVVDDLRQEFAKAFGAVAEIEAYWGGVTTYQSYLRKSFDHTQALTGLMFLLSLFLFRIFLGTWRGGVVFNITVFIALIASYGLMGFLGIPVDVLTNSTGLMVIVSSLEDFVFVVYGVLRFGWSMRKALRKFLLPAFFTSLTTAIGFGSLAISDLGIIRRFGVVSSFALMLEWVILFLALPALLRLRPQWLEMKFKPILLRLKDPLQKKVPRRISWLLIALAILTLFFVPAIQVKDSPEDFFFNRHPVSQTSQHLLKSRGWINEATLLLGSHLSDSERDQILQQIKTLSIVALTESGSDVKKYLSEKLDKQDSYLMTRLWEDSRFSHRLVSPNGVERIQLFLKTMDIDRIKQFREEVEKICPDKRCELVGTLISYNEFSTRILSTLFESLGLSMILIALIIFFISGHLTPRETLACILSSIWGPLALLGIFVIFQIPLFFVSCICASVLVGLAGDNAIQFIFAARRNRFSSSVDSLSEASLIISFGMITLTSVFLLSIIAPLAKLGGFIILGFILGYLGDVWILRGLLKR